MLLELATERHRRRLAMHDELAARFRAAETQLAALAMTDEEREALEWARVCVASDYQRPLDRNQRALALLDRLLALPHAKGEK